MPHIATAMSSDDLIKANYYAIIATPDLETAWSLEACKMSAGGSVVEPLFVPPSGLTTLWDK